MRVLPLPSRCGFLVPSIGLTSSNAASTAQVYILSSTLRVRLAVTGVRAAMSNTNLAASCLVIEAASRRPQIARTGAGTAPRASRRFLLLGISLDVAVGERIEGQFRRSFTLIAPVGLWIVADTDPLTHPSGGRPCVGERHGGIAAEGNHAPACGTVVGNGTEEGNCAQSYRRGRSRRSWRQWASPSACFEAAHLCVGQGLEGRHWGSPWVRCGSRKAELAATT